MYVRTYAPPLPASESKGMLFGPALQTREGDAERGQEIRLASPACLGRAWSVVHYILHRHSLDLLADDRLLNFSFFGGGALCP